MKKKRKTYGKRARRSKRKSDCSREGIKFGKMSIRTNACRLRDVKKRGKYTYTRKV